MALSQKGAGYDRREHIADPYVREALDDLASQTQAIRTQGNFGAKGIVSPPTAPAALSVSVSAAGIYTANVLHKNPPTGTRYVLQYSTSPNFSNPVSEELGANPGIPITWQKSLPGQKLSFRVAAKFSASDLTAWVYFGTSASPMQI